MSTKQSDGELEMDIVKDIIKRYFIIKIFALSVSVIFLIAYVMVVAYDLVVILPVKYSQNLRKYKDFLRDDLVE